MRSLFFQLSLLVATITTMNLNEGDFSLTSAVLIGLLVGSSICFILMLGDLTINRVLEDRAGSLASVRFFEEARDSDWLEESISEEIESDDQEALAA